MTLMPRSLPPTRRTSNARPTLVRLLRFLQTGFAKVTLVGAVAFAGTATSCTPAQLRPELAVAATSALALSDALEKLIAEGKATNEDREAAYDAVQALPAETAGDAFGRAAIIGRLAEKKGALAILGSESPTSLVGEAEKYARLSRKLDPEFRQGAATRMLGTLYVMAPANLLESGNSEDGIEILEHLVATHPEVIENQLRLAEGYIALNDKDGAKKPLCISTVQRATLRADDAALLDKLTKEISGLDCKAVLGDSQLPGAGPASPEKPEAPPIGAPAAPTTTIPTP